MDCLFLEPDLRKGKQRGTYKNVHWMPVYTSEKIFYMYI